MQAYIYAIKNIVNGKMYIGQTINKISRWSKHRTELEKNIHHNVHLQNSYNKYGKDNFEYLILESYDEISEEQLGKVEAEYIKKYGYYNIDDGRKSIDSKGRKKMSDAHLEHISSRRVLTKDEVLMVCVLDEFIGNIERPLSSITGFNRIVFKGINKRETYSELTKQYDVMQFEEKLILLSKSLTHFGINIAKLNTTNIPKALLMIYMKDKMNYTYNQIATLFGVDKRSVARIYKQETLSEAKDQYNSFDDNMKARLYKIICTIFKTITCQA